MPLSEIDAYLIVCDQVSVINLCTHRNVGAVIVKEGGIVSVGRNTMPGCRPCSEGGCPRGTKPPGHGRADYSDCVAVHAEMNAIIRAGLVLCRGSLLVVNSRPCHLCLRLARGAEIHTVAYRHDGTVTTVTL